MGTVMALRVLVITLSLVVFWSDVRRWFGRLAEKKWREQVKLTRMGASSEWVLMEYRIARRVWGAMWDVEHFAWSVCDVFFGWWTRHVWRD